MKKHIFPESQFAHQWLDGLAGLEIGPSTHNPFGLQTRNVGLGGEGYVREQMALTGTVAPLDIVAEAGAIPLPSESEDFILASHVIEHCPDFIRTVLEWYRIVKVEGYLFMVVPHRDAAPSDRGKPLTEWAHLVQDYMLHATQDSEPEQENFLYCHYHVFSPDSIKRWMANIFQARLALVGEQDPDDKVGNGFVVVYRKTVPLAEAFPWSIPAGESTVHVQRPADFYQIDAGSAKVNQPATAHSPKRGLEPQLTPATGEPPASAGDADFLVSAIVPAYNSERFMRGVLEDLVNQTLAQRLEIIVVETGSETNELEIIREYQQRYSHIVYVRTAQRLNATAATNVGVRIARGRYLTVAPTDDRLRHDALEIMAQELDASPDLATVYADVFMTQFENQTFRRFIRGGYSIRFDYSPDMMLSGYHMGPLIMWRKTIHEQVGLFNESYLCASDYEFHCRVARLYPLRHIPQFLGVYLQNPTGTVNANPEVSQAEFRKIIQANQPHFPPPVQKPWPIFQYDKPVSPGKFVNIGMVTFNRLEFTRQALTALFQHTCFPHVITVVDNGSTDGTREYLTALQQQGFITNLVLLPENVGIAKASNLAWSQEPEAAYYLKLDNDIVIQKPGWLSRMVEVIDRIPELGAVAYSFEPVSYPVCEVRGTRIRPKNGNLNGACTLIPKRTHDLLGFWCEDYGLYGEEDADYGLRMMLQGLQNAYMEDEQVGVHLPAGRAARIDARTFEATDGIEENIHKDYRAFKDESRRKNLKDIAQKNWQDYQTGVKKLYCSSFFVQAFQQSGASGSLSVLPAGQEARETHTPQQKTHLSCRKSLSPSTPREVSIIVSDQICGTIRLLQPLLAGRGTWKTGSILDDIKIVRGDVAAPNGPGHVWVIQRTCLLSESMLLDVQRQGTRLVYDCDDLLWDIPHDNPNHRVFTQDRIERMFRQMKLADGVTVSTGPIQTDLKGRGIASTVIPNALVQKEWEGLTPQRRAGTRPRIGWAGQATVHQADLAMLETLIEALKDEVEWVFMGDVPPGVGNRGVRSEWVSMVDLLDFPKKLASLNLDLALAPLAPNRFNEAKSDLRVLQYGILGYPVIGTDIVPHQQAPICRLPHDPQVWIQAIRERIHDLEALAKEGDLLRQWVLSHRLIEHVLPLYEQAWLDVPRGQDARPGAMAQPNPVVPVSVPAEPASTGMTCSIIIPVWNKLELTRQCLTHLAEVTDGCAYEVIVVDNHSTDGTHEFLQTLAGDVQIMTNPENYGFAKACNQGAAVAKGRYLVFLNNDTIPKPGWLRALTDEVDRHPDVAIAGSRLLYPDGTIQHAGVAFSKSCLTPYHIFNRAPGDLAAVNVRREYQAVTGACLLIRKEEFEAIGGFDEGFRNGFEDVDLCLKVRDRGHKVVYQPASVLIHLEHQTPGRKDAESERQNGERLMIRWASTLVVDEDAHAVQAGYAIRNYFRDGWLRQSLEPLTSETERRQWTRVQRVQELLLNRRYGGGQSLSSRNEQEVGLLLAEAQEWPEDKEVLKWAAGVCQSMQLHESERTFLNRLLSRGEQFDTRKRLATLALAAQDLTEAAEHVRLLQQSHPGDGPVHRLHGILLMQSREFADAAKAFRQAIRCGDESRQSRMGLGMASMGAGEVEDAWSLFEQMVNDDPDDDEVMNWLIQSGTALQRWDGLSRYLSRYVERNPADCDMRYALAGVEFRAGRHSKARYQYDMLMLLKPDYEGLQDLGKILQTASAGIPASVT